MCLTIHYKTTETSPEKIEKTLQKLRTLNRSYKIFYNPENQDRISNSRPFVKEYED
jgi:hypothetical protein